MFSFFVFFLLNKYLFKKILKEKGYNFEKVMGVFFCDALKYMKFEIFIS